MNGCLVVLTILKNINPWEGLSHITMENKHVPNHQPDNHNYEDYSNIYLFRLL